MPSLALVCLAVLPVAINLVVWQGWLAPTQAHLRALQETRAASSVKPELEALLANSRDLIAQWKLSGLPDQDPASATRVIEQVASRNRVAISTIGAGAAHPGATSASSLVPIEVKAQGRFHSLARWLDELEAQAALQVEEWTFEAPTEPGQPAKLAVKLTALLGA